MANGNNDGKVWNVMQAVIGVGAFVGLFANQAAWFSILWTLPKEAELNQSILAILNQGSGSLLTFVGMVIGYYFGSSKSSADKDESTKQANKTAAEASASAATLATTTAETLKTVISGTGAGGVVNGIKPSLTGKVEGELTVTPTTATTPATKETILAAAGEKFKSGEQTEDVFRATLRALQYTDDEINAAVTTYKSGG